MLKKLFSDGFSPTGSEPSQSMETQCSRNGRRPQKARRVISKTGDRNISFANMPQRSKRYIQDFFTTVVSYPLQIHCETIQDNFGVVDSDWYTLAKRNNRLFNHNIRMLDDFCNDVVFNFLHSQWSAVRWKWRVVAWRRNELCCRCTKFGRILST